MFESEFASGDIMHYVIVTENVARQRLHHIGDARFRANFGTNKWMHLRNQLASGGIWIFFSTRKNQEKKEKKKTEKEKKGGEEKGEAEAAAGL